VWNWVVIRSCRSDAMLVRAVGGKIWLQKQLKLVHPIIGHYIFGQFPINLEHMIDYRA
jgi:hypothetical protein